MTRVEHQQGAARIGLAWAGSALVLVAIMWSLLFPWWPNRFRLLDAGKIVDYSWAAGGLWLGGLVLWLTCWASALVASRDMTFRDVRLVVISATGAMLLACASIYPATAIDVYIYAVRSRLLTEYGANPHAVRPVAFLDSDPYMRFASREWWDNLSPYGPLWNLIAAPITWLGGDSITVAIIGFKVLGSASVLGIAFMIHDAVGVRYPALALRATLFWLWNPLVLWDGVANAHNDVVMLVPLVGALWAWIRCRTSWVVPLIACGAMIKVVPLIFLPVACVAVWRRSSHSPGHGSRMIGTIGASALVVLASFAPFFDPRSVWTSLGEQGQRFSASPAWIAVEFGERTASFGTLKAAVLVLAALCVGIAVAISMLHVWRHPEALPGAMFDVLWVFMVTASTNHRAWYALWLVPMAAILLPELHWVRAATWSIVSMFQYVAAIYLWHVWDFDAWGRTPYHVTTTVMVFTPIFASWGLERQLRRRSLAPPQLA